MNHQMYCQPDTILLVSCSVRELQSAGLLQHLECGYLIGPASPVCHCVVLALTDFVLPHPLSCYQLIQGWTILLSVGIYHWCGLHYGRHVSISMVWFTLWQGCQYITDVAYIMTYKSIKLYSNTPVMWLTL